MMKAARAFAGADGVLLLSWHGDDVATVVDASPAPFPARALRMSRPRGPRGEGVRLLDATEPLPSACTLWLPRRITAAAMMLADVAPGELPTRALLFAWCEPSIVDLARLDTLRPLVDMMLSPDMEQLVAPIVAARLDVLMRAALHGIVFVNEESRVAQVNAEAARMLRLPEGDVDAPTLVSAMRELHRHLANAEQVSAEFARVLTQPDASIREWIWEFTGPTATALRVSSVPVHHLSGRGRLWMFDDITAEHTLRRELEQQLERERRREQQQLEAVTRLTAGIAHDFSNLLTVIGGSAEMLHAVHHDSTHRVPLDRDSESDLHAIRQATQRANALIRQLLSFAGRKFATPELLELDPMLQRMAGGLAGALDDPRRLQLRTGATGAHVRVDERQLSLALMTFVANAREQLGADGTITVRSTRVHAPASADTRTGERAGRYVAITVGVSDLQHPPEIADDLRLPFTDTASRGARGEFGLGIVSAVAEQAGGTIRYSQFSPEATQYALYLPEADVGVAALRHMTPAIGVTAWSDATVPILVVDDDAGPRRVLRRLLEREGYAVLAADSGTEALRHLELHDGRVAGVISDYLMPGMSGMELLTTVRARWPALPVVLVSGFTYDDVTGGALKQLRAQFLPKPFTRDELLASIRAAAAVMQMD